MIILPIIRIKRAPTTSIMFEKILAMMIYCIDYITLLPG